jgi:outer membrane lipoprotein carrier protein
MRAMIKHLLTAATLLFGVAAAHADAVDRLRDFVRDTKSGRAAFTQTVTPADGSRAKVSTGNFEFARPDRFRFDYAKPYPQTLLADGQKVWMHDPDLNQVTVRKVDQALGATPAALLAGNTLERDFSLSAQPARDGLDWARATPKVAEGGFQWMAVGFRGAQLAAVEILDRFGQRTLLKLDSFVPNAVLPAERFRFVPPPGADVIEQ